MAGNYRGFVKKWTYVFLSLLLLLLITLIIAVKSSTSNGLAFASEERRADANQAPDNANEVPGDANQAGGDANEPSVEKAKSAKEEVPRPEHKHPAFGERIKERTGMVATYIRGEGIRDPNVLRAMRTVPRHAFVLRGDLRRAYNDHPLPIGLGQTISQPYIVAYMTEYLKIGIRSKVLEIGTGSGYQAAVCAEIAREVYTIEILEELAKSAKKRLRELGYNNVSVKAGDGYFGWKEKGPFDAIIVTAAAGVIPPPLIEQLKPDGKMILPVGSPFGIQTLVLISKDEKGEVHSKGLLPVRFVPMTGRVNK